MPACRQMSLTGTPASACLRIETIWVSVKRDFFMEPPGWGKHARKFYLWGVCGSGKLTVTALQLTIGLLFTPHYFLAHALFCLSMPFYLYAMDGSPRAFLSGWLATAGLHFAHELWEDQLTRAGYSPDWDQILAGTAGLVAAWLIYRAWNRQQD